MFAGELTHGSWHAPTYQSPPHCATTQAKLPDCKEKGDVTELVFALQVVDKESHVAKEQKSGPQWRVLLTKYALLWRQRTIQTIHKNENSRAVVMRWLTIVKTIHKEDSGQTQWFRAVTTTSTDARG